MIMNITRTEDDTFINGFLSVFREMNTADFGEAIALVLIILFGLTMFCVGLYFLVTKFNSIDE